MEGPEEAHVRFVDADSDFSEDDELNDVSVDILKGPEGGAPAQPSELDPPALRLSNLRAELRAMELKRRHMEITGELWLPQGAEDDDEDDSRGPWGPHGTLTHDILALKMRVIALCHLTSGSEGPELAEAHCDLASTYAQLGLWPQVSTHAGMALKLLQQSAQETWNRNASANRSEKQWPVSAGGGEAQEVAWSWPEAEVLPALCRHVLQASDARGQLRLQRLRDLLDVHEDVARLREISPALDGLDDALDTFEEDAADSVSWPLLLQALGAPTLTKLSDRLEQRVVDTDLLEDVRAAFAAARSDASALQVDVQRFLDALPEDADLKSMLAHRSHPSLGISGTVPITWAEIVSYLFLLPEGHQAAPPPREDDDDDGVHGHAQMLLKARLSLLMGRYLAHDGRLEEAVRRLKGALALEHRLEDSPERGLFCELRVAVAEALVMLQHQESRAAEKQLKQDAELWLCSDEGHARWKEEARRLAASTKTDLGHGLSRREAETLAREPLLNEYVEAARPALHPEERLDEAAQYLLQAWQAKERMYGRTHVEVADACSALGSVHLMKKNANDAAQLLSSALGIYAETVGTNVPTVAALLVQLGRLQKQRGERFIALQYLCSAATFYTDQYNGPAHADTDGNKAMSLWSEVAALCDKPEEAVTALLQAVDVCKLMHGPSSMPVAKACVALAGAYKRARDYDGAKAAYTTARGIYAKRLGRRHAKTKKMAAEMRDCVPPEQRRLAQTAEPTGDEAWLQL